MRIGIYGSSFDPITNVHLWTANTVARRKKLDKVIFLPASSKRIDKTIQTSDRHRLAMIDLAIGDNPQFELNTWEMNAPVGQHYTYFTMEHFRELYPQDELFFIMGADLLQELSAWRFGEELVSTTQFIVMARDGIDMLRAIAKDPLLRNHDDGRFHLIDKGLAMEISSSYIRDEFRMGGDPRYLLPDSCYFYIKGNQLYTTK